ncbi:helix-turn-helix domain-containing protein [bacterium]|nr:helix-turn-helix domain-containing protein [bacterium]
MSYLSTALNRLADLHGLNQADIVRQSRLSRSHVSRLFTGEPHHLSNDHFVALLKCFGRDPRAQADLVAARCLDVRVGPQSDKVHIIVQSPAPQSETPDPKVAPRADNAFPDVPLPPETERAFAWLRSQCPVNPDLEQHLIGYARLTGMPQ